MLFMFAYEKYGGGKMRRATFVSDPSPPAHTGRASSTALAEQKILILN